MARWSEAAARADTSLIEFGSRAAHPHLLAGWASRRTSPRGLRRGEGELSAVGFFLAAPRPLRLEVRAGAPAADSAVDVEVNGRSAGTLRLAPDPGEHELDLPPEALRSGENEIVFRHAGGALFDRLRLRPAIEGLPEADAAGGLLRLPLGSEVAYFLELPPASVLRLDALEASGAAGESDVPARLLVFLQEEGHAEQAASGAAGGFAPTRRPLRLELSSGGSPSPLVKLSLRAAGEPGPGRSLLLRRPRIHAPAPKSSAVTVAAAQSTRPNLLVYLIDTLRADRLGCYGATGGLTPAIDEFAGEAVLFERAYTSAPWTRPAVATLLTGLDPLEHGVQGLDDRLPAAAATLPERLRAAGYRTAALSTNWHVTRRTGMDQGFDDFLLFPDDPHPEAVARRALAWLDGQEDRARAGAPFFLYIHALDPHAPYEPPPELRRRFAPAADPGAGATAGIQRAYAARGEERRRRVAELAALYDAEVAWADRGFDALLDGLRARGRDRDTVVVLLADHGEELDEHGELGHGRDLFGETVLVPLVVRPSGGGTGRREPRPVGLLDVAPTLLAAAGLDASDLPGRDLLAPDPGAAARPLFTHLAYERRRGMSVVLGDWKLIAPGSSLLGPAHALYDLRAAPAGRCADEEDLAPSNPVRAGFLAAALRAETARARPRWGREPTPADEETRRALRALGYQ